MSRIPIIPKFQLWLSWNSPADSSTSYEWLEHSLYQNGNQFLITLYKAKAKLAFLHESRYIFKYNCESYSQQEQDDQQLQKNRTMAQRCTTIPRIFCGFAEEELVVLPLPRQQQGRHRIHYAKTWYWRKGGDEVRNGNRLSVIFQPMPY